MAKEIIISLGKLIGMGFFVVVLILFNPWAPSVQGESYPNRPITLVTPYAPGGVDLEARVLASQMSKILGVAVLVEPRGGAGGTIGTNHVVRSNPDGYTLLYGASTVVSLAPNLHDLPYTMDDLIPIASVSVLTNVLAVRADAPWKTIQELVDYAKKNPGAIKFGSGGAGSFIHMLAEVMAAATDIKLTHVPYKGSGAALVSVIGGHIDIVFAMSQAAIPQAVGGKVRILVITGSALPDLPGVPTFKEAGIPVEHEAGLNWLGFFAPKGTPRDICDKLTETVRKTVSEPEIITLLKRIKSTPDFMDQKKFKAVIVEQSRVFKEIIDKAGLKKK